MAITSRSNPKIRLAHALRQRKTREKTGLFLVEGAFHIGAALEASAPIEFLVYSPRLLRGEFTTRLIAELKQKSVAMLEVSPQILTSLSDKENPAGILAVTHQKLTPLSSLIPDPSSLFVALVAPQDPGNLGSILRTIDAAGASALVLLDGGVDAHHPSAVRAAMGAHFWKPLVQASFGQFVDWAKKNGLILYGSSARAQLDFRKAEYRRPCALLLGSEREGLTDEQMAACEEVVGLPMRGHMTSLNMSVAAGILIYEIIGRTK